MEQYITATIAHVLKLWRLILKAKTTLDSWHQTTIKKQELDHKKALDYIDRATDEEKSLKYRNNILEAMKIAFRGQPLEKWAGNYQLELAKNSKSIEEQRNYTEETTCKLDQVQLDRLAERLGIAKGARHFLKSFGESGRRVQKRRSIRFNRL